MGMYTFSCYAYFLRTFRHVCDEDTLRVFVRDPLSLRYERLSRDYVRLAPWRPRHPFTLEKPTLLDSNKHIAMKPTSALWARSVWKGELGIMLYLRVVG